MKRLVGVLAILGAAAACGSDGPLKAAPTLAHQCVRPGSEQIITVRTRGNAKIAYAITYPNGKPEFSPPAGSVPKSGVFKGTFKIPADSPSGTVKVLILVAHGQDTLKQPSDFKTGTDAGCV